MKKVKIIADEVGNRAKVYLGEKDISEYVLSAEIKINPSSLVTVKLEFVADCSVSIWVDQVTDNFSCWKCNLLEWIWNTFSKTNKDYWRMTNWFVWLHGGTDHCP